MTPAIVSRLAGDQGVIVHTSMTIGYDTPWRQVQAMLRPARAAARGVGEAGGEE